MNKRNSYRTAQFKTREEADSGDLILSGYFIKFDEVTELWPGYFEVIKREGVEKAIKGADIRALFNHDDSLVLGRTGNGTVILELMKSGFTATSSSTRMTRKLLGPMLVFSVAM